MRITLSVIKADVGSIGGHTQPSERMMESVREDVAGAINRSLIIDGYVSHTGDDIAIIMSHTRGEKSSGWHKERKPQQKPDTVKLTTMSHRIRRSSTKMIKN